MLYRIKIVTNHQITHLIYIAKTHFISLLTAKIIYPNPILEFFMNHLDYL